MQIQSLKIISDSEIYNIIGYQWQINFIPEIQDQLIIYFSNSEQKDLFFKQYKNKQKKQIEINSQIYQLDWVFKNDTQLLVIFFMKRR